MLLGKGGNVKKAEFGAYANFPTLCRLIQGQTASPSCHCDAEFPPLQHSVRKCGISPKQRRLGESWNHAFSDSFP